MPNGSRPASTVDQPLIDPDVDESRVQRSAVEEELAAEEDVLPPKERKQHRERRALIESLARGESENMIHRVALTLNRYPDTRDSDVRLMLKYWEAYHGYQGGPISPEDLFERTRLTSLARARARIQNTHGLFQASPEIRQRRGTLSEEERERARESTVRHPGYTVVLDESGKNGPHLIVGAVWFSDAQDFFGLTGRLLKWRQSTGFDKEMHFKELDERVEPFYREAVELLLAEAATVSFKAASMPRAGISRVEDGLEELMYQLLRQGAQHEHVTGRARYPRVLQVWKDQDAPGADKVLLARLKERIQQAGKIELDGGLTTDPFEAVESRGSDLVQLADLFSGALNRTINVARGQSAKDRFAEYLLKRIGMSGGPSGTTTVGDLVLHIQL